MERIPVKSLIKKRKIKSKRGQSMVEFLVVSIFFVFMLAMSYQAVIIFTVHQYLYYASFMAARAYQTGANTPAEQRANALSALKSYLPAKSVYSMPLSGTFELSLNDDPDSNLRFEHFGTVGRVVSLYIPVPKNNDYGPGAVTEKIDGGSQGDQFIGVKVKIPFVSIPLGEAIRRDYGVIEVSGYSFLGREVTKAECRSWFEAFANDNGFSGDELFMEDQGC